MPQTAVLKHTKAMPYQGICLQVLPCLSKQLVAVEPLIQLDNHAKADGCDLSHLPIHIGTSTSDNYLYEAYQVFDTLCLSSKWIHCGTELYSYAYLRPATANSEVNVLLLSLSLNVCNR